jgi:hypothetical protein
MKPAPQSVQEFRRIVRQDCRFYRGVDPTADLILDECIAWVIADVFAGKITSHEQAAKKIGRWLKKNICEDAQV